MGMQLDQEPMATRRKVNRVVLRFSQFLLILVFWIFSVSIVKAFEQNDESVVILQYHHVSDETPFLTSIKPDDFEVHVKYLHEQNFEVISLREMLLRLKERKLTSRKTAVITFDDAYLSVYETAWPLLKEYNMPFSVFVNTESVGQGNKYTMTWAQMKEMSEQGVEFGNHTHTHLKMILKREGESDKDWRERLVGEIKEAESLISKHTGQLLKVLAYPFGEYTPEIQALLKELDYVGLAQHSGAVGYASNLEALPRFAFGGFYTDLEGFKTKVNALPMPVVDVKLGLADKPLESGLEQASQENVSLSELSEYALDRKNWLYRFDEVLPQAYIEVDLDKAQSHQIACYASGQGRVPLAKVKQDSQTVGIFIQAKKTVPIKRSRFNCTLPSQWPGRFYWFSQPIIREDKDGSWFF